MATDWESVYSGQKATDARMEAIRLACKVCGGLQDDCECGEKALERISELEAENVALRAERRTILDSVTWHCTSEQINAITADTLAARGRKGESEVQP